MAGLSLAGLGGFAQGLATGLKTSSDMADAEERRGLMRTQAQSEKLKLERDQQVMDLNKQLKQETTDWQSGAGAYAPQEGQQYDAGSEQAAALHYSRIQPLLEQQASLQGKSILDVRNTMKAMQKEQFAERSFRAAQLLQEGDPTGLDVVKPIYNKLYRDGRELVGGAYDPDKDTFTLNYKKTGSDEIISHAVKREDLVNRYMLGALTPENAVKVSVAAQEADKERKFKSGEADKERTFKSDEAGKERTWKEGENRQDRGLKRELVNVEQAGANTRASNQNATSIKVAEIGKESRENARGRAIDEKNSDDFNKELDMALGFTQSRAGIYTPDELATLNKDRSEGKQMFEATRKVLNQSLTGAQAKMLMDAYRAGKATVKVDPASGYAGIEYGGIRAVAPASLFQKQ